MFFINIKNPTSSFNISSHVSFSHSATRSVGLKLKHNIYSSHQQIKQRHFYFNDICRLWNSLPILNLNLSTIYQKSIETVFLETLVTMLLILISYIISALAVHVSIASPQTLIICSPLINCIQIMNSQQSNKW